MNSVILTKIYKEPPICCKEILRYAGCRETNEEIESLISCCLNELQNKLAFRVCYGEFDVTVKNEKCDFGSFCLNSENLAENLKDCKKCLVFAATIGVEIDRLIAKYGRISPSKALIFQAIGAERIEALCDAFCKDMASEYNMQAAPRFSAGYGDLPLLAQKDFFSVLEPEKRIGLTLNDSLVMSPSKSVTAIVGLCNKGAENKNKCSVCKMKNCAYRGAL